MANDEGDDMSLMFFLQGSNVESVEVTEEAVKGMSGPTFYYAEVGCNPTPPALQNLWYELFKILYFSGAKWRKLRKSGGPEAGNWLAKQHFHTIIGWWSWSRWSDSHPPITLWASMRSKFRNVIENHSVIMFWWDIFEGGYIGPALYCEYCRNKKSYTLKSHLQKIDFFMRWISEI